jgi:hypothetical protein
VAKGPLFPLLRNGPLLSRGERNINKTPGSSPGV